MAIRKTFSAAILTCFCLWQSPAHAHHALEFIDVTSYTLAEKGQFVFYLFYDHKSIDADDPGFERWEFTPGLSYGVTDWLMVDAHTHYAKFGANYVEEDYLEGLPADARARTEIQGASPMLEAVTVGAQVAVPRFNNFVDVGFLVAAEFPFRQARRVLGADKPVYEAELILHREFGGHRIIAANLINVMEHDGERYEHEQEWRLGFRSPLTPNPDGIAAGLELEGNFSDSDWFFMPAVYAPIMGNAIFKTGLQVNGREGKAHRFHASLMYLF